MKRVRLVPLALINLYLIIIFAILTWHFYGSFPAANYGCAVLVWIFAIICFIYARIIKKRIKDNEVGMDRRQLNPVYAASWFVIGTVCAWAGAVLGGMYAGISIYIVTHMNFLVAASDDAPAILTTAIGSYALLIAGIYMEKCCEVPPPPSGEAA